MTLLLAALIALQDTIPPRWDAAGAFLDSGAARLVAEARLRRERAERLVSAYEATVRQRVGVGIRALRRDRMLYRQELAARISWRRDSTSRVEFLGARHAVPVAIPGLAVPDDLDNWAAFLAFDPAADYLRLVGQGGEGFLYPLADGAEAHYRYRSGDTTTITLPDGRELRLVELRVHPRRSEFRLMAGSLWFDAGTYGLVRAVFRPARPFDFELDAEDEDDDVPGILKPIRAEVRYVSIEYGLSGFRWWLPRFVALDAEATAGTLMRVPVRFEREYSNVRAEGGSEPLPGVRRRGAFRTVGGAADPDTLDAEDYARIRAECEARRDSLREEARREARRDDRPVRVQVRVTRDCVRERTRGKPDLVVVVPADTLALIASPALGQPILDMGGVISENELRDLSREIGALPGRQWQARPELPSGVSDVLRHSRYNRVEALSFGARLGMDMGRAKLELTGRLGVADLKPEVELGLTRPSYGMTLRASAYRRLAAANPEVRPFGLINSAGALLAGRDDGEYFRATGLELTGRPGPTASQAFEWRLYAERQRPAEVETRASLPRLLGSDRAFRPNIAADTADQAGASALLRWEKPLGLVSRLSLEARADGQAGDFSFGRGAITAGFRAPLGGRLVTALEAAAGSSTGGVPVQSNFFLGGPATLRGYSGGAMRGEAFWRVRGEVANALPALRLAVFSDVGFAGPRAAWATGRALWSAGVGASFLDGLLRVDLGRALRTPRGWRLDVSVDGVL